MALYEYKGKDVNGNNVSGVVDAKDENIVLGLLEEREITVYALKLRKTNALLSILNIDIFDRIKFRDIVISGGCGLMGSRKAVLKGFDSGSYTATVQLAGSHKVYLEAVTVARNLPVAEMVTDRKVVVVFFDAYNAKEAVVIAVYT